MARPKKEGVDYFSHDVNATSSRTVFTLESKFGNDGYAFWFKLLEILGSQSELYYDCRNPANWLFLTAKTHVSEVTATEILDTLSQVDAIDADLWCQKVIWVQKFSERLCDVFHKRGAETPRKPSFCDGNPTKTDQSVTESTQSKVKESKVKESKEERGENDFPQRSTKFIIPTVEEIKIYCSERKNGIDAQHFFDFYESKGWMIGKNKMKNWKSAVGTWERRNSENAPPKKETTYDITEYENSDAFSNFER